MTNTVDAVNWVLQEGANALEIDINFSDAGAPQVFYHCNCFAGRAGVCNHLGPIPCEAQTDAATLLRHIATKPSVALVIIDSKVGSLGADALSADGGQIITLLDNELFARGYRGDVIVGAPDRDQFAYVSAAANAVLNSSNRTRYYYSIDQESDETNQTIWSLIDLQTSRRVYGTGISACSAAQYYEAVTHGAANERAGVVGLTYTWTIDKESTMRKYLQAVARGIITNNPGTLASVLRERNAKLVAAGSTIPIATSSDLVSSIGSCDCDYHSGGCAISKAAPANLACRCTYGGAWPCAGTVASCSNPDSLLCQRPNMSAEACALGGGDCEGY